ncbi:TonB-dependent receptor [Undibacterium griseum]|uniref:TonB-dependent receptor n=1 Tax=Undibacterium griseum TaxID=2762295 RepID=A0ABR6YIB2_9BURK|nr:TonB-dependent receptor [Undibacterium griseum]MBC3883646.1 TonB-dependent receptor [Undibacterium griseum]
MSKKNLVFKKTLVARALTLAFGVGVVGFGYTPEVMAQSNAVGTVYGKVSVGSATSVVIKNADTNLTRNVAVDATGKFQATALPAGHYKATLMKDSATLGTTEFDVLAGQGVEADFGAVASGVQSVEVSARRTRIDVSNASNGATFTAKELAKIPVAQSVAGIIQLAPNTTKADSRYAGGASFGGGGASENSYYINGFPVVNPLTQLGSSELPFGAIGQAQILTGGFGAEFGRSVGGVMNITTKSGTNNWEMGATFSINPNALRSTPLDIYYPRTGAPENASTDGTLYLRRSGNTVTEKRLGAYVGGPIIQDKLFMFVAVEDTKTDSNFVNSSTASASVGKNGYTQQSDDVQRYMGKFDWNITDDHRLELTLIGDTPKSDVNLSGYNYATGQNNGVVVSRGHYQNVDNVTPSTGANIQMLKYTGNLTSDLTLTALAGKSTSEHKNSWDGYDVSQALYQVSAPISARVPGLTYTNPQALTGFVLPAGAKDEVKSFRLDLEYKIGQHTIRGGLDSNKNTSLNAGDMTAGGGIWTYSKTKTPTTGITLTGQQGVIVANGGGYGTQGYYVRKQIFSDATTAYSDQTAQYIEDRYQVTKDILVTAGLRNEGYKNKNGDGETFLEINRQLQPRLSAAWDVNGDSSTKVFGSLGRYSVPIPTHLAVRGASRSTYIRQYYTYTGVDPVTGTPTGLNPITGILSPDNEFGQAKLAATVAALDMKPNMQDEITLGFEKAYSPSLNFGAKFTYRKLRSTIDDFCDQRPFDKWAAAHNVDTSNWGGFNCASFNPGEANSFMVDFANTGKNLTRVDLSAADLGFEKAERNYTAFDVFLEHPYRNGWYGKINYTWSRSKGNTEGQTLSDVAQTDVSATQTWDHYEIMQFANGLLPNDRTHQIKAFGFYDLNKEWTIGANLLLAAGRPKNCLGTYPQALQNNDPGFPDYGSAYHYCNELPSPRGSVGNLPWDFKVDMNLAYKPEALKGVAFKIDVFNLFNKQTIQTIDETYNLDATTVSPTYGRTISYTAPRNVRLAVEYNHKF